MAGKKGPTARSKGWSRRGCRGLLRKGKVALRVSAFRVNNLTRPLERAKKIPPHACKLCRPGSHFSYPPSYPTFLLPTLRLLCGVWRSCVREGVGVGAYEGDRGGRVSSLCLVSTFPRSVPLNLTLNVGI